MPITYHTPMPITAQQKCWSVLCTTVQWTAFCLCLAATAAAGYTVATLFALSCLALPISTVNAVLAGNLVIVTVLGCAIVWAFASRYSISLWAALLIAALFLGVLTAMMSYASIGFALAHQ